jgi:hypothetical protein
VVVRNVAEWGKAGEDRRPVRYDVRRCEELMYRVFTSGSGVDGMRFARLACLLWELEIVGR